MTLRKGETDKPASVLFPRICVELHEVKTEIAQTANSQLSVRGVVGANSWFSLHINLNTGDGIAFRGAFIAAAPVSENWLSLSLFVASPCQITRRASSGTKCRFGKTERQCLGLALKRAVQECPWKRGTSSHRRRYTCRNGRCWRPAQHRLCPQATPRPYAPTCLRRRWRLPARRPPR
jgi:hypothetical protein